MAGKEEIPKELSPFIMDCYKEGEKVRSMPAPVCSKLAEAESTPSAVAHLRL